MMRQVSLILAALALGRATIAQNATATKPATGKQQIVSHRGFRVDVTEIASAADRDSVTKAVKEQLDMVADVKLSAAKQAFFRSVPLTIQAMNGRTRYSDGRIVIPLHSNAPFDREHPVLLHELCHAYHDRKLADGFNNKTILALYDQARKSGKFPADSYMLSNTPEYFAMMTSVFLHGSAMRDPFSRDSIRIKQPAMYAWLVKEFGTR